MQWYVVASYDLSISNLIDLIDDNLIQLDGVSFTFTLSVRTACERTYVSNLYINK